MTIQESLEVQAVNLGQNHSQRAVNVLHLLKTLATWLYIAQVRKTQAGGRLLADSRQALAL